MDDPVDAQEGSHLDRYRKGIQEASCLLKALGVDLPTFAGRIWTFLHDGGGQKGLPGFQPLVGGPGKAEDPGLADGKMAEGILGRPPGGQGPYSRFHDEEGTGTQIRIYGEGRKTPLEEGGLQPNARVGPKSGIQPPGLRGCGEKTGNPGRGRADHLNLKARRGRCPAWGRRSWGRPAWARPRRPGWCGWDCRGWCPGASRRRNWARLWARCKSR